MPWYRRPWIQIVILAVLCEAFFVAMDPSPITWGCFAVMAYYAALQVRREVA